jgi:hypothetical protein
MSLADTPAGMIARLDESLERRGQDAKLRRLTRGPNDTQIPFDCAVRVSLKPMAPDALVGDIDQTMSTAVLSPTPVTRAQWPLPVRKGDKLVVDGRERDVMFVKPFVVGGTLVRIELMVAG